MSTPTHETSTPMHETTSAATHDGTRPVRLLVLSAGTSIPSSTRSLADGLARATRHALEAAGTTVEVHTVELRDYAHDVLDLMLTRFPSERLDQVLTHLREADGVVLATPIYSIGPSALFSAFLQATDPELWRGRPVLLGATGGTARHSLAVDYAIRPVLGYLKAQITTTSVFAATSDMGADGQDMADEEPVSARIRRAGAELAAAMRGSAPAPDAGTEAAAQPGGADPGEAADDGAAADPVGGASDDTSPRSSAPTRDAEFEDFVPMDQLLRQPRG